MADRRVVQVVLVGDNSSLNRALDDTSRKTDQVADHAQRSGEHIHNAGQRGVDAFSDLTRVLGSTGVPLGPLAESFDHLQNLMSSVDEHGTRMARTLRAAGAAGAAAAGIGGVGLAAAAKDQTSHADLQAAVEATGRQYDTYAKQVEDADTAQVHFGHTAHDVEEALSVLTTASQDPAKALGNLHLATELAAHDHSSLAEAAGKLASVYAGNFRVFRELGINMKDAVDPAKELAKATADNTAALAQQASAAEHLRDVEARVAAAQQAAQEKKAAAVESATSAEQSAEETLAERRQSIAERIASTEQQAADRVTSAREQVTSATQHLDDVEAELADRRKLSEGDVASMRDAELRLARVRADIATGRLKGVDASRAEQDAQQRVLDLQRQQSERAQLTLSDQVRLREAHKGVADAHDNLADAQHKQADSSKVTTAEQVELRKAVEAVATAHEKVIDAQKMSTGISLGLLQEERKARSDMVRANGRVKASEDEIAQAHRDQAELGAKIDQAFAQATQRLGDTAEKQADTIAGAFHRVLAELDNEFAHYGGKYGAAITAVGVSVTALAAIIEVVGPSMGVAMTAAFGPVGLIIAGLVAVGVAAYELWTHWDQVWGWISHHKAIAVVVGVLAWPVAAFVAIVGGLHWLYNNWNEVWTGIQNIAGGAVNFISQSFDTLTGIGRGVIDTLIGAVNTAINLIDSFQIHIPSIGIGPLRTPGFDWNGANIPTIPLLDTGGIVTMPTLAMLAGNSRPEAVIPLDRMIGGGGGLTVNIGVNVGHMLGKDTRAANELADTLTARIISNLAANSRRGNALPVRT